MSPWRSWVMGLLSGVASALVSYWHAAPEVMRIAAMVIGPLLVIDGLTAMWMQRVARWHRQHPQPDDVAVTIYTGDTWTRAGTRFIMTLSLICLAATVDAITGSRHMTVLWVLLWGVTGHARATLRHLETIARMHHLDLPIFPTEKIGQLQQIQRPDAETPPRPAPPAEDEG